MQLRCERKKDAELIAAALEAYYTAYRYKVMQERRCRTYTLRVYCRSTGALLMTRAEV